MSDIAAPERVDRFAAGCGIEWSCCWRSCCNWRSLKDFDFEAMPEKLGVPAVKTAERLAVQQEFRMPYPTGYAAMC